MLPLHVPVYYVEQVLLDFVEFRWHLYHMDHAIVQRETGTRFEVPFCCVLRCVQGLQQPLEEMLCAGICDLICFAMSRVCNY